MNRKFKTLAVSILLMGIGVMTTAATLPTTPELHITAKADAAVMTFKSTKIDLGSIPQGIPVDISFELKNEGGEPLIIERAKPSCGCTGVDYPKTPIAPGETATISATYNAKSQGAFTKTITVYSNASSAPQVLRFTGEVKA